MNATELKAALIPYEKRGDHYDINVYLRENTVEVAFSYVFRRMGYTDAFLYKKDVIARLNSTLKGIFDKFSPLTQGSILHLCTRESCMEKDERAYENGEDFEYERYLSGSVKFNC